MTNIELVIKIPEDSYKATCSGSMLPPDVKNVVDAIKNGTPLDKIRAEIEGWQIDIHDNENDADKHDFVFERIYEIIDEYKLESEE